jgi:universal stress protein E
MASSNQALKHILVLSPHEDRAGCAANLAAELAQRTGAKVTLLRVLERNLTSSESCELEDPETWIRDLLSEVETRRVGELAERFRARGIEVCVEVRWGVPWEVVLELVERDRHDLVVKPASGMSHAGRVFFGYTALQLFRRCPCPTWVVGDEGRLPKRILAAIDPTAAARRRAAALRILDWAERVGAWADSPVHVATAWHAPAAELLRDELPERDWKAYVDDARNRSETDLRAVLAERASPIDGERTHLLQGAPQDVIPRFSHDHRVDLIVMGTLHRSGAVGDLLGETAETILREVRSSVLTIPPERSA